MAPRHPNPEAVATLKQAEMSTEASVALMKWLSRVTRKAGVAQHVYVVGGAVRNFLLEKPIKDIDMVVDSLALRGNRDAAWVAQQVARAIPAPTKVWTDSLMVSHITVEGPWSLDGHQMEGEEIEIVNARLEEYAVDPQTGEYTGHKPERVEPTTMEIDISRREFTFNTLMWTLLSLANGPDKAEIIDLTGCGLKDLKNREMRCPGDPDETFAQDPTRIIRTIKFAFKYGMKLPPDVKAAAIRQAKGLKRIPSKTQSILQKIVLDNPQYKKALDVMDRLGVNAVIKEIMLENKPFRSFMESHARKKGVAYMLDLMDVGIPVGAPISFLDAAQQKRFREVTSVMDRDAALDFLGMLRQTGSALGGATLALAQEHGYRQNEMRDFSPVLNRVVRDLLLEDPSLAASSSRLVQRVRRELPRQLPRRASSALVYGTPSDADRATMEAPPPIFPLAFEDFHLIPPPDQEETLEELQDLRELAEEQRPEAEEFIKESDGEILHLFDRLWRDHGVRVDKRWMREMVKQAKTHVAKLKWHFNRPRPYQVGDAIGQPFEALASETAHSPSYPSGHAIQAFLLGEASSRLDPEHAAEYFDLVDQIAWGRAQAGYHWPSDILYGVEVADHMADFMDVPEAWSPRVARIMERRASHALQRHRWAKTFTVNKGDPIWYGKYKNKRGIIDGFSTNEKGDVIITVEQVPNPTGRKQPKELKLFRVRPREVEEGKEASPRRVVAKYKSKKEVPKADGSGTTTVYEYGPRQVAQRHKEKAKRLEGLKASLSDLRGQVSEDMVSDDPETRLTALAVALLDKTYERVGNEKSADDRGHFGITTLRVSHLDLKDKKATFEYVGKSGVKQKKVVTDPQIIEVLKAAVDGKEGDERILCDGDDCQIRARHVNGYLKPFDITAKDLRGLHANEEMRVRLKDVRKKGESLPRGRKDRDKILKAEFKEALEAVAEAVGHQASTLRSQYLVPGLEDFYMKDGTVIDDLAKAASLGRDAGFRSWLMGIVSKSTVVKAIFEWGEQKLDGPADLPGGLVPEGYIWKMGGSWYASIGDGFRVQKYRSEREATRGVRFSRVAHTLLLKQATKSEAEREEEEAQRLVRKSPKKKPPRVDLERRHVEDSDSERDPDKEQDRKDTSHNFKDIAASMAARRVAFRYRKAEEFTEQEWKTYKSKHPGANKDDHTIRSIGEDDEDGGASEDTWEELSSDEQMDLLAEGAGTEFGKIQDEYPNTTITEEDVQDMMMEQAAEGVDPFSPAAAKERKDQIKSQAAMDSASNNLVLLTQSFGGDGSEKVESALQGLKGDDRATFLESYEKAQETAKARDSAVRGDPAARKELLTLAESLDAVLASIKDGNPGVMGEVLALFEYASKVLFNPSLIDPANPVSDSQGVVTGDDLAKSKKRSATHAANAFERFKEASPEERAHSREALAQQLEGLPDGSAAKVELQGVVSGLLAASALHDGEEATGVGPTMQLLVKALDKAGAAGPDGALFAPVGGDLSTPEAQEGIRAALTDVLDEDWGSLVEEDDPIFPIAELLSDESADLGMEDKQFLRTIIADYLTDEITVVEEATREDHQKDEPTTGDVKQSLKERRKKDKSRMTSALRDAKGQFLDQSAIDEAQGSGAKQDDEDADTSAESEGAGSEDTEEKKEEGAERKKGFFAALLDAIFPDSRKDKWQAIVEGDEPESSTEKTALDRYDLQPWDTSKLPTGNSVPLDAR